LDDAGPATYAAIMGDEGRQREHAQTTLRQVRNCLEAAAGLMERALTAN
jgi:hypothetical protein